MSKILLVGNDFRLLTTRAAVLAQTNAKVAHCNALQATRILQQETFDLVVLCHSLTEKQVSEITGTIHQNMPGTRILMITFDPLLNCSPKGVAIDGIVSADPRTLVRRTTELLLQHAI